MKSPKRGDIIQIILDPTLGHEQSGYRPALVISANAFNVLGMCMVCPITQGGNYARGQQWVVPLVGTGTVTQGAILCNQARMVDWKARKFQLIESVDSYITEEVIAKLATILE
jgi:mRNA interferase ChpB